MDKKQNYDVLGIANGDLVRNYDPMTEYGKIGQFRYAGVFFEEYEKNLQGRKGIEVYKEMSESDSVIGAILFAMEMLMRQADWDVETKGKSKVDKEAAEFVKSCMDDMQDNWQDTISEIMSFLVYGWSFHEICYKRRMGKKKDSNLNSKYDDGLIGWKKLPIRAQDTLWRWEYDENDELVAMSQMAAPDFELRTIPLEKGLLFRTKSKKNNPEGRSLLRSCYRDWYFKKRMQEIEGIGVERDLAGLPMITPPEGLDIWDTSDPEMARVLAYAEKLVQNVRRDSVEGVVMPFGWTFQLLNGGSRRQFEIGSVIERYDSRIAMTVLADFVLLGHQQVGSFALSSDKTKLFGVSLGAFMDIICEVFNTQAIPRLIELNAEYFKGIEELPKLIHGDVETPDLNKLGAFIKDMTGVGILVPDENLESYVRRVANLPEAVEGEERPAQINTLSDEEKYAENMPEQRKNTNTPPDKKKPVNGDTERLKEQLEKAWEDRRRGGTE